VVVHEELSGVGALELLRMLRNGSRTAALPLMLVAKLDGETADAGRAGVDEVLASGAKAAEISERLGLLTERSPHASAWRSAPVAETPALKPATNRRSRAVPVPAERRAGRQSANRPKS
jgi:hypothetical protein